MPYKYYKQIESEEHMLFITEIAKTYHVDPLTTRKVIKEYAKKKNIVIEPLYYNTSRGLTRVYPSSLFEPAMLLYIEKELEKI